MSARIRWTAEEDATLRRLYPHAIKHRGLDLTALLAALPGRGADAIRWRAKQIGVTMRRRWTPEEDEILRGMWGASETSLADMAARFNRTINGVYHHATMIPGLPSGAPEGWEYVKQAARRTGFSPSTFKLVLAHAGLKPIPALSVTHRGTPTHHEHILEIAEVDQAVKEWLDTEPISRAAARLGVCPQTLEARLAGVGLLRRTTGRQHWRVRGEDIERAIARWPLPGRAA